MEDASMNLFYMIWYFLKVFRETLAYMLSKDQKLL